MKKQFRGMQENMDPSYNRTENRAETNHASTASSKTTSGKPGPKEDYIEFEDLGSTV